MISAKEMPLPAGRIQIGPCGKKVYQRKKRLTRMPGKVLNRFRPLLAVAFGDAVST
jgi:hypothetical protein